MKNMYFGKVFRALSKKLLVSNISY